MKKLITIIAIVGLFTACAGPKGSAGKSCTVNDVENGALVQCQDGTEVLVENGADGQDLTEYIPSDFEGSYELEHGGSLTLMDAGNGQVIVTASNIRTKNFDNGTARHPELPIGPYFVEESRIVGFHDPFYDKNSNDVENDFEESTNIEGRRDTVFIIYFSQDKKLKINIKIYRNGEKLVNRVISEI